MHSKLLASLPSSEAAQFLVIPMTLGGLFLGVKQGIQSCLNTLGHQ